MFKRRNDCFVPETGGAWSISGQFPFFQATCKRFDPVTVYSNGDGTYGLNFVRQGGHRLGRFIVEQDVSASGHCYWDIFEMQKVKLCTGSSPDRFVAAVEIAETIKELDK